MFLKIKNIFLNFFILNKKSVVFLLLFIILGTLTPFYFAGAWLATAIAISFFVLVWWKVWAIALIISGILLTIPTVLLWFVTSPAFLRIDFATDPFIMVGWTITRDLANMFFILFLVVIALATILRINDYQAKKTLPILIAIILLINFTPVFADIIIDSADVFMRFFLGYGVGLDAAIMPIEMLIGSARLLLEGGAIDFRGMVEGDLGIAMFVLAFPIVLVIFSAILALVFFIFAMIFMIRPIALMMLVILSPIAFLCYVFPATKKIWDQWWNQFLNWSFVGITAAFFLYLIDRLAFEMAHVGFGGIGGEHLDIGAIQADPGGIFLVFVPSMVLIGFALMGLMATFSISASGASHMIGAGKKVSNFATGAAKVAVGNYASKKLHEKAPKYLGKAATMMHNVAGSRLSKKLGIDKLATAAEGKLAEAESSEKEKQEQGEKADIGKLKNSSVERLTDLGNDGSPEAIIALSRKGKEGQAALSNMDPSIIINAYKKLKDKGYDDEVDELEQSQSHLISSFTESGRSKREQKTADKVSQTGEDQEHQQKNEEMRQNNEAIPVDEDERKRVETAMRQQLESNLGQSPSATDLEDVRQLSLDATKIALRDRDRALAANDQALAKQLNKQALEYNSMAQAANQKIAGVTNTIDAANQAEEEGKDPNEVIDKEKTKRFKQAKEAEENGNNQEAAQHMLAIREMEKYQTDKKQTEAAKSYAKDPAKLNNANVGKMLEDPNMKKKLMEYCNPMMLRKVADTNPKAADDLMKAFEKKLNIKDGDDENTVKLKMEIFQKSHPSMARYLQSTAAAEFGFKDIYAKGRGIQAAAQQNREQTAAAQQAATQRTADQQLRREKRRQLQLERKKVRLQEEQLQEMRRMGQQPPTPPPTPPPGTPPHWIQGPGGIWIPTP